MKLSIFFWLGICTLFLVSLVVMSVYGTKFHWMFFATLLGQGLWIFTVFKVLKDDYKTHKTFDDFYEDRPDLGK